ncbi:MAG: hypothetical protein R3F20_05820 [Planctomycetota bacterium]
MLRSLFPFFLLGIVAVLVAVWAWPEGSTSADDAADLSRREEVSSEAVGPGRLVDLDRDVTGSRNGDVAPEAPSASPDLAERRSRLQALRDEGKRDELRLALSETVLDDRLPSRLRERSLAELRDLNRELVFRGTRSALACASVKAVRNDSLTTMARRVKKAHGNNVTPA